MINVYGEGLIDLVPTTSDALAPLQPALGGGPFNAAIAAARLGANVQFISRLSTDHFGEVLYQRLISEGVGVAAVERGEQPSTLAVTAIGETGAASYTFYVEGTADRFAAPTTPACDIASFGTLSLHLEPAASRYAECMQQLFANGVLVALDPNIRPLYANPARQQFLQQLLAHVDLLKLSDEEIDFMGGKEVFEAVPVCVVTRGGDGLEAHTPAGVVRVPGKKITVVDTIGAGDTVMGALLAWIDQARGDVAARKFLHSMDTAAWEEALNFAASAAAVTCSRKGAQPPTRAEL